MAQLTASYEYAGLPDYWGGNGRRWDENAGCLFAHYDGSTTLRDLVDQLVDSYFLDGECEAACFDSISPDDVREAILASMSDKGRADYKSGALSEFAERYAEVKDCEDDDLCDNYPFVVMMLEIEVCPDCDNPSGESTCDGLCDPCYDANYGGSSGDSD